MAGRRVSSFKLRPAAQDDLEAIWLYSAETWSITQADEYIRELNRAFELLVAHPQIAARRPELADDIRVKASGAHVILYRIVEDHIDIIRIRHASEDWMSDSEAQPAD